MGFWKPRAFSLCARVYWEWIWHLTGRKDHASPPVSFICVFHSWYFWLMARTSGVFFFLAGLTELTLTKPTLNSYTSLSHLKKKWWLVSEFIVTKKGISWSWRGREKSSPCVGRGDSIFVPIFCFYFVLSMEEVEKKYPGLTQLGGTWPLSLSFLHLPSKSDG